MLFMPTDAAKPIRIQGVYVSDTEVERLVEFWKDERFSELTPETADDLLEQALAEANGGEADIEVDFDDPVVDRARELTLQHQRISASLLQRRLRVGFLKANKIISLLEEEGLVGPREDGESRKVLVGAAPQELD
jgi:S-DNA-T family DNA segregation ATPase FtsK/SpoIIIE